MRGFECELKNKLKNGTYERNYNNACFSDINRIPNNEKLLENNAAYISEFEDESTKKYIKLLLRLINKITPCTIVDGYIRFELMPTYNQSLILLNFIRNLWNEPNSYEGYSEKFFKALVKGRMEDPLARLTNANKIACTEIRSLYSPGHSNCHPGGKLKVKTTDDLRKFKGTSTQTFLTT